MHIMHITTHRLVDMHSRNHCVLMVCVETPLSSPKAGWCDTNPTATRWPFRSEIGFSPFSHFTDSAETWHQFRSGYLSCGLRNRKTSAAAAPPAKLATRKIQMFASADSPMMVMPTATAGLKAPPEIEPTA